MRARSQLSCGERKVDQLLQESQQIHYRVYVGSLRLTGHSGAMTPKDDGCWVEPREGREEMLVGGEAIDKPIRLSSGDAIQVGIFSIKYQE